MMMTMRLMMNDDDDDDDTYHYGIIRHAQHSGGTVSLGLGFGTCFLIFCTSVVAPCDDEA